MSTEYGIPNSRHSTLFSLLFRSILRQSFRVFRNFFSHLQISSSFSISLCALFHCSFISSVTNGRRERKSISIVCTAGEKGIENLISKPFKNNNFFALALWQQWKRKSFRFFLLQLNRATALCSYSLLAREKKNLYSTICNTISMIYNLNLHWAGVFGRLHLDDVDCVRRTRFIVSSVVCQFREICLIFFALFSQQSNRNRIGRILHVLPIIEPYLHAIDLNMPTIFDVRFSACTFRFRLFDWGCFSEQKRMWITSN